MWKKNSARNHRNMRISDKFNIPISRFTYISNFPHFEYQRLWNDICHNNQDLSIEIPKKTFKENFNVTKCNYVLKKCINGRYCIKIMFYLFPLY